MVVLEKQNYGARVEDVASISIWKGSHSMASSSAGISTEIGIGIWFESDSNLIGLASCFEKQSCTIGF